MLNKRFFTGFFLFLLIMAVSCTSKDRITGKASVTEENGVIEEKNIYESSNETQTAPGNQSISIEEPVVEQQNETINNVTEEYVNTTNKTKDFEFSPDSIVSTQNNISISIDNIKSEIKSEYWGKITGISTTILNNGNKAFKPKILVILYDEKDLKEEWFQPKTEIEFEIDKLNIGGHITKDAIVNIAFDDISLIKKFKLILTDDSDIDRKALVVAEEDFKAK